MQKNSHITGHLLSLILGKEIHDVDLDVNKRLLKNRSNSKTNILDIRVKFNNGEDCNIEMQVVPYQFMPERMLDYWAGMYDNEILKDELAQWLKFIENPGNKEVEKFMEENRFLKQAKEELAYLSDDPDFQLIVDARVRMLRDIYSFEQQGKREGEKNKQKEIAKKLKELEIPIDKIIKATGLTKEEIEKL